MKKIVLLIIAMLLSVACSHKEDVPERAPYKEHNKFHHKNRSIDHAD